MKGKFIKELAHEVIKENHHWKDQYIKLQFKLKDYQTMMVNTLESIGQIHAPFDDPYSYLKTFIDSVKTNYIELKKNKTESQNLLKISQTQKQYIKQLQTNQPNLYERIKVLQQQYIKLEKQKQQIINNQKIKIQSLSAQINQKTNQIQNMKKKHQLVISQIVSNNKQKIHQLIANNKNQMLNYRKVIQQDSWRIQFSLRNQLDSKNQQIKKLVTNIDKIKQNNQTSQKDWLMLQRLMKPYSDHSILNQKISQLRKQLSQVKNQNRNVSSNIIQYEIDKDYYINQYDKIKQKYQNISLEYQNLQEQYNSLKAQLQQSLRDKENMTRYYDDKWIQQFNKVRINLQKKIQNKSILLEDQYILKKQQIKQEIVQYQLTNKQLLLERQQNQQRINILEKEHSQALKHRFQLLDKINELKQTLIESDLMHQQQLSTKIQLQQQQTRQYQIQIQDLQYQLKYQKDLYQLKISKINSQTKCQKYKQQQQIKQIHEQYLKKIQEIKNKHQQELKQLDSNYQNAGKAIQEARNYYSVCLRKQIALEKQRYQKQLEIILEQHNFAKQKLENRIRNSQYKLKQIQSQKEQARLIYEQKQKNYKYSLQQRQKVIASYRDNLQQIPTIKAFHSSQIQKLYERIQATTIQNQSLKIMIQSKQAQISQLNRQLVDIVNQKIRWDKSLKDCYKEFQSGFNALKNTCDHTINFYRSRIWELQRLVQRNPINAKDLEKIRSLSTKNKRLQEKIQMKQAQNLILNQVKAYYQTKVQIAQIKIDGNMQQKNKSIYVKKNKKRNGLLILRHQTQKQGIFQTKQLLDMRKYINTRRTNLSGEKQKRENNQSSLL